MSCIFCGGTQYRSWFRFCATSRKVAGSIPREVIRTFHWLKPSGHTMALGSTQPLTEISQWYFLGCKSGRWLRLTTLSPTWANCLEIWGTTSWSPKILSRPVQGMSLSLFFLSFLTNISIIIFLSMRLVQKKSRTVFLKTLCQCFSTFVRPRPVNFFFHKTRTRSQQIYS